MRDKIKFKKLEEISLAEIQLPSGENGGSNKVECVLLVVIRTRPSREVDVLAVQDFENPFARPETTNYLRHFQE